MQVSDNVLVLELHGGFTDIYIIILYNLHMCYIFFVFKIFLKR